VVSRPGRDRWAERLVADIEAAVAEDDLVADVDESGGQSAGFGLLGAQEVERQALRRLRTDPRQAGERFDQPGDRLDDGLTTAMRPYIPGRRSPPVTADIFCSASSREDRSASLTAAEDEVLEHLDVVGVDRRRIDGDADRAPACR
jgi:hypothetical protein